MGVWEQAFVAFGGLFFEFLTPLFWTAITFSILFHFWQFLMHYICQKEWFNFCLDTKNNWALPLDLVCFEHLSVTIVTNEQLKDLTHMHCLWIPCYKLYKEVLFIYIPTLKYMCHFGMSWKKFNLEAKHKIKKINSRLFFNSFNFVCFYLLT